MLRALIPLCLCVAVGVAWAQVEPPEATVDKPISLIRNGDFVQDLGDDWVGGGDKLKVSVFDAKVDGFTKAVRLECSPEEGAQPWDVGFGQLCTAAVGKDDAVYFRAWMRSLDSVRISFIYESTPAYTKVIIQEVRLTPEWKEYRFMGRAFESFQPDGSQAKWWLGYDKGVVELAGVRVENYGPARNHSFDQTFDYWGGREHSDAWRAAAVGRIEKLRKGDLTIRVMDADGRPVPNAQVKLEQKRHHFRFGTCVPAMALVDTRNPYHVRFRREVARLFNTVTFGNDLKVGGPRLGYGRRRQANHRQPRHRLVQGP